MDLTSQDLPFIKDDFHNRMLRNFKVPKSLMTENDRDLNDRTSQESGH